MISIYCSVKSEFPICETIKAFIIFELKLFVENDRNLEARRLNTNPAFLFQIVMSSNCYSFCLFMCFPERTAEEVERTKQFGKEVVDLLRHQPHCRMPFSKFIPTYHHHFGRQCKLSYYGFTKLMELFEAIPDILMVRQQCCSLFNAIL